MDTRVFSVYNSARGALLNSMLKVADSAHQPLKLLDQLISGLGLDSQSGLWLTPVASAPLVPRVFPFDFVYLDKDHRVLHAAEIGPGIEFPPYEPEATSALVLPSGRILSSKTAPGDSLIICLAQELDDLLAASNLTSAPPEKFVTSKSTRRRSSSASPERTAVARTSAKISGTSSFEESIQNAVSASENSTPATLQSATSSTEAPSPPSVADQVVVTTTPVPQEPRSATLPAPPKPSISITEAEVVTDRARAVPPAIVEHHTDPEDLFSNWVVTPSATPGWIIENGFDSPIPSAPPARPSQRETDSTQRPESPQLSASSKAESKTSPTALAAPGFASETCANIESNAGLASTPPNLSQPDSSQSTLKHPVSAQPQTAANRTGAPRISTTTTFSSAPYTMWQVSMATAVTPGTTVKLPPKPVTAAAPVLPAELGNPGSNRSAPSAPAKPDAVVPAATLASSSVMRESDKSARADSPVPARRSTDKPAETPSRPTPTQFVSSMQERLERLQQTHSPAFHSPQTAASPQRAEPVIKKPVPPEPKPSLPSTLSTALHSSGPSSPQATPDNISPAIAVNVPPPAVLDPKPRISAPEIPRIKTAPPLSTLKSKLMKWLSPTSSPSDRRRAHRHYVPGMVAHYFTGGAPKPHSVADISMTGFYLLTDDRWMPGTMIQMTLQKPCAKGERKQSMTVLSRVVRRGSDGVATEFVMPGTLDPYSHDVPPSQATDKFALARFL
ncbi:MAG TPA: PilZ domain-containing protein [Terracidiphilus sp.]